MKTKPEKLLQVFLRVLGSMALTALFCALMPYEWMNATHRSLGLGELPNTPIVCYLTRSISCLYALLGAESWVMSFDVRRFRPLIQFHGIASLFFGGLMVGIDWYAGMPASWTYSEGPGIVVCGLLILAMCRHVERTPNRET